MLSFLSTDLSVWIFFNIFVVFFLALDLFLHREARVVKLKEALIWSFIWILLAFAFAVYLYFFRSKEDALVFITGYLIEKALSVDNLFVFLLVFQYFRTPSTLLHHVLFWGVLGAIIMRCIFIFLGVALISMFHWILYVFGAFLIFTGIKFAFEKEKEIHPQKNPIVKLFSKFFPLYPEYAGNKFFKKVKGKNYTTPLFLVLLVIETTDLVFALDSIPVILGITQDPLLVYTSNIFAILGLRSLYFVLSRMIELFYFLHYGLALILVLIGLKMILSDLITFSIPWTLASVLLILFISVALSLLFPRKKT